MGYFKGGAAERELKLARALEYHEQFDVCLLDGRERSRERRGHRGSDGEEGKNVGGVGVHADFKIKTVE